MKVIVKLAPNYPDRSFVAEADFIAYLREQGENWNDGFGPVCLAAADLIGRFEAALARRASLLNEIKDEMGDCMQSWWLDMLFQINKELSVPAISVLADSPASFTVSAED